MIPQGTLFDEAIRALTLIVALHAATKINTIVADSPSEKRDTPY